MDRNLLLLLVLLLVLALIFAAASIVVLLRARKSTVAPGAVQPRALPLAFSASLSQLRGRVPTDRYQYRVPWVLGLGEPGAGKTTLLEQLAADDEGTPDDGSGVRWRFLSRGALIEVPGAFLAAEDHHSFAGSAWNRFVRLLLRHRSERPIDGIVLFVPTSTLLASGGAELGQVERQTLAATLRARLNQLQQTLGIAAPVYVVVTKCDQIRGFQRFFEAVGPQFEDDMFGWSNPNTLDTAFHSEWVDGAFKSIGETLLRHQLRAFSLQEVASSADDLFLFPLEFKRLHNPLRAYLTACFEESSYLDPHFLRGIYFCGDASVSPLAIAAAPPATSRGASHSNGHTSLPAPLTSSVAPAFHPKVVFARHLFDSKVFLEAGIVRPLARIWFPRNRLTLGLQVAVALFVLVFGLGTWLGYVRLLNLRDHKFKGVLEVLVSRLGDSGSKTHTYPLSTAYDFVDDLGVLDGQGFRSFFLPASWRDPINADISNVIAQSFSQTVLPSLQSALNAKAVALIGNCGAIPAVEVTAPEQIDSLELRTPKTDVEYIGLESSLHNYTQLREAIRAYDSLRSASRGSFADLNVLFGYLTGRSLQDESRFRQNLYYQRALQQASYYPVPSSASGRFDDCVRLATSSRTHNFFDSWFQKNNPLIGVADGVASQIDDLQASKASSRDKIESLVNDIRGLDNMLSGGSYAWLNQTNYNRANYPVLSKTLPGMPFADKAFLDTIDADGSDHFSQTKSGLLSTATLTTGSVLNVTVSGVRVSAQVMALQNALGALLGQDFMSGQVARDLLNTQTQPFIWNKTALTRASQMEDSYDKYLHEWLPLLPSGLRDAVRSVAGQTLQSSVLGAVATAQEQLDASSASDPSTLLLEIQSFQAAAPAVLQLQTILPPAARGSRGDLQLLLTRQCLYLADRIGQVFQAGSLYEPAQANLKRWDGTRPLTEIGYGVRSDDELETYFARQRDQVKKVSLDYAEPLAQYLTAHRIEPPKSFDLWPAIVRDVQEYEAKKPGGTIAALETFIRSGLGKIDPHTGCATETGVRTGSDYFLALRVTLQSGVVARCGELLKDIYSHQLAAFFNQHLAGNFPFAALPTSVEAPQASPSDALEFFSLLDAYGPGLITWLPTQPGLSPVLAFVKQAQAARQMLTAPKDGSLFSDLQIAFRANRSAEVLGDRIIDWEFRAGDQVVGHVPSAGLRWSYGSPVTVTLRFAKNSPEIPLAGVSAPDARVVARTVTYSYTDPWALFSLLRRHYGGDADYAASAGRYLGLLRFVIPVTPDTALPNRIPLAPAQSAVRVFIRTTLRVPGTKEPVEVPVAAFPELAPPVQVTSLAADR